MGPMSDVHKGGLKQSNALCNGHMRTPPPLWTERQIRVKTLHSRNFAVINLIYALYLFRRETHCGSLQYEVNVLDWKWRFISCAWRIGSHGCWRNPSKQSKYDFHQTLTIFTKKCVSGDTGEVWLLDAPIPTYAGLYWLRSGDDNKN